jgi:hypothetical protein
MTKALEGGCACGALRYRLESPPMFVHSCHCRDCQRQTGSAFVLNALIETARVTILQGDVARSAMPTDSGRPHGIDRCTACGTAVWSEYGGLAAMRFVRVGTLDDPSALAPDVHIYVRSKLPWVALPDGVPAFEAFYSAKTVWPAESLERRRAVLGK